MWHQKVSPAQMYKYMYYALPHLHQKFNPAQMYKHAHLAIPHLPPKFRPCPDVQIHALGLAPIWHQKLDPAQMYKYMYCVLPHLAPKVKPCPDVQTRTLSHTPFGTKRLALPRYTNTCIGPCPPLGTKRYKSPTQMYKYMHWAMPPIGHQKV